MMSAAGQRIAERIAASPEFVDARETYVLYYLELSGAAQDPLAFYKLSQEEAGYWQAVKDVIVEKGISLESEEGKFLMRVVKTHRDAYTWFRG